MKRKQKEGSERIRSNLHTSLELQRSSEHKKGVMKKRFTTLQQQTQAKEDFLKALANDSSHFDGK